MSLRIRAIIDGDTYSERQLDNIQYEREKRTLQEMIHLGANVFDGKTEISYDDVNYLSKADAKRILRETKERIGFQSTGCGTSQLMDGTCRQDIAFHQIKPTENGLILRSSVYFPKNTPQEMVDGHKIHLAIESMEMIRIAYLAAH